MGIFSWVIKRYWKLILIGVIALGFAWHYWGVIDERDELRRDVQAAEIKIKEFKKNEKEFIERIKEYNEQTDKLKQQKAKLEEKAKQSRQQRRQVKKELNQTLKELNNKQIENNCESAVDFLREHSVNRNKAE